MKARPLAVLLLAAALAAPAAAEERLRLSTTTSTQSSGLLEVLLRMAIEFIIPFENKDTHHQSLQCLEFKESNNLTFDLRSASSKTFPVVTHNVLMKFLNLPVATSQTGRLAENGKYGENQNHGTDPNMHA